jgi:DNA-binding response OmpR family regulator
MSKILIADDSKALLDTLETILSIKGYELETANSLEALIDKINSTTPDLIIMSARINHDDSRLLCRDIAAKLHHEVPIILTSGDEEVLSEYQEYEAIDFIEKPFELSCLLEKIERVVTKSRSDDVNSA